MKKYSPNKSNTIFVYIQLIFSLEIFLNLFFFNSFKIINIFPNLLILIFFFLFLVKHLKIRLDKKFFQIPFANYLLIYVFVLLISFQYFNRDIMYHLPLIMILLFLFTDFNFDQINLSKNFDYFNTFLITIILIINIFNSQNISNYQDSFAFLGNTYQRQYSIAFSAEVVGSLYLFLFFLINKLKFNFLIKLFYFLIIIYGIIILNSKVLYFGSLLYSFAYIFFKSFFKLNFSFLSIVIMMTSISISIIIFISYVANYLIDNRTILGPQYGWEFINNLYRRSLMFEFTINNFNFFTMDSKNNLNQSGLITVSNLHSVILERINIYGGIYIFALFSILYQIAKFIHKKYMNTTLFMIFCFIIALGEHTFPNIIFIYICLYSFIYDYNKK